MEQTEIHQLIQQGLYEKALEACFNNIEAHPEQVENYINSGILLSEAGEIEKAEKFFQRALTINSNNAAIYYNFANVYFNESRFQEAIKLYQKAIQKGLDNKDTNYMIGMSFYHLDAKKQALPFLMRAAELDQTFQDLEVQFQYGLLLCELEMFDQAITILTTILDKDKTHADAQYNLTLANYMVDEAIDKAIEGFTKAIKMDPNHMLSHHALKTFNMIKSQEEE